MRGKRSAALLLALLVAAAGLYSDFGREVPTVSATLTSQKSDLEAQKARIQKELAQIEANLKATKNSIAEQEQYQAALS